MEEYVVCLKENCEDSVPDVCRHATCDAAASEVLDSFLDEQYRRFEHIRPIFASSLRYSHLCPRACGACRPEVGVSIDVCAPGWSYADGECYQYRYGSSASPVATWSEAEEACRAQSAHLALVETPAQEHLVFQLVKERRPTLGPSGLWAWVGVQCSGPGNWTWAGLPREGVSQYFDGAVKCRCSSEPCERSVYTNSIGTGDTRRFHLASSTVSRRAWICSKPAAFLAVRGDSCEAAGLQPISDWTVCEAVTGPLLGMRRVAANADWRWGGATSPIPSGCWMSEYAYYGVRFIDSPSSQSAAAEPRQVTHLCRHPNASVQETSAGNEEAAPRHAPRTTAVADAAGHAALLVGLVSGFLPVVGLLVLAVRSSRRRDLSRWGCLLMAGARLMRDAFRRRPADKHTEAVEKRLRQWRDAAARTVAALLLCFHLGSLLRTLLVQGAVCAGNGAPERLRELLAAVHAANVWLCATFLASQNACAGRGAQLRHGFVVAATGLALAEAWLLREQDLLLESRLYRQLVWQLLLGACVPPALAIPSAGALSLGCCLTYRLSIPDGMIFTVGTTRAGVLFQEGCNALWEPTAARSMLDSLAKSKLLLSQLASMYGGTPDVDAMVGLVNELLQKATSFREFLLMELMLLAAVAACLALLQRFLRQGASRSLKLQSSADQLAAISRILANYTDATFVLAGDGRIVEDALKLDVMLNFGQTPRGLRGREFASLVASPEDGLRFEEAIRPGATQGLLAGDAMYLDLRAAGAGAMRGAIRVQLLCAEFADDSGERRLLFGVAELQTDGGVPSLGDTIGPIEPGGNRRGLKYAMKNAQGRQERMARAYQNHMGTPMAATSAHSGSLGNAGSDSSEDSDSGSEPSCLSSSGSSAGRSVDLRGERCRAVIELAEAGAKVRSASHLFKAVAGIRSDDDRWLSGLVRNHEWLVASLRCCVGGGGEPPRPQSVSLSLVFRPLELACEARAVPRPEGFSGAPVVQLQVLSARSLAQPAAPGPPPTVFGAPEPEGLGKRGESHTMEL